MSSLRCDYAVHRRLKEDAEDRTSRSRLNLDFGVFRAKTPLPASELGAHSVACVVIN